MQVETLGRYKILKELGRGAMGRVYLAHDPRIDRQVAIKTIQVFAGLPEKERAAARERFLREARAAGKLVHPRVVTLFDADEVGGVPYLAMEYVEGTPLDRHGREGDLLPVAVAVSLVAKTAEALADAHDVGIVHRDVKPANLMRVGEDEVKIMDFGLAQSASHELSQDGTLMGTPNYMAPEQIRGGAVDGRADLFSLAVVLYELLTGVTPFGGDTVSSVLYRIVHEEPRDIAPHLGRLPESFGTFFRKALAKEPSHRFKDGRAFAASLREAGRVASREPAPRAIPATEGAGARLATVPLPEPHAPHRAARWPYFVGAALVLAGIAAGYALLQRRGESARVPAPVLLEARIVTEPPALPVLLDGKPITAERVQFAPSGPFGTLTATKGCRTASHTLQPSDAQSDIVLAPEPSRAELTVDPGVSGAEVLLEGTAAGKSPVDLNIDLCSENRVEVRAGGYKPVFLAIPAGASVADARAAIQAIRLEALPTGKLTLPKAPYAVSLFIDGNPAPAGRTVVDLPEGRHTVRALDDARFVDVEATVDVRPNESARAAVRFPPMATLVVQMFPPDGKVFLRQPKGSWRFVDEPPARTEVAAGRYEVRVEYAPTGETREEAVDLRPGENPPLRFSFRRPGS